MERDGERWEGRDDGRQSKGRGKGERGYGKDGRGHGMGREGRYMERRKRVEREGLYSPSLQFLVPPLFTGAFPIKQLQTLVLWLIFKHYEVKLT